MKKNIERLLCTPYRVNLYNKAIEIVDKLKIILPATSVYICGSFATKKRRPADIDFFVLVKAKSKKKEKWAIDFVIFPDNIYGEKAMSDLKKWMKERYGKDGYGMIRV